MAAIRFRLPKEIEDPTIARFDVAALPVATYAVSSALPADKTRLLVEDQVKPLLQQVDGVAGVEVNGGLVREIQVNLDPRRLDALRLADLRGQRRTRGSQPRRAGRHHHRAAARTCRCARRASSRSVDEIGNVILRSTGGLDGAAAAMWPRSSMATRTGRPPRD